MMSPRRFLVLNYKEGKKQTGEERHRRRQSRILARASLDLGVFGMNWF